MAGTRTPLMEACWRGDVHEALRQIEAGADVNASNANGTTALMYAKTHVFSTGNVEILKVLIDHGAMVDARDSAGKTARDYTIERCDLIIGILDGYTT